MKIVRRTIVGMIALVGVMIVILVVRGLMDARVDYVVSTAGVNIPKFHAVDIPFDQNNDFSSAHPFAGGAVIDIDGDGIEELFLGGGPRQSDAVMRYVDGSFQAVADAAGIQKANHAASFGVSVIDTVLTT